MEIFNVSIPELILIAGLALVVFGPERLPEIGRFLGKQVAKLLAWQQNSPELQMLNEVRGEFESEIASLRDELVRTRKQFDVSKDMTAIRDELRPMLDLRGSLNGAIQATAATGAEPSSIPPPPAEDPAVAPPPPPAGASPTLIPTPASQTVPAAVRPMKPVATEPTSVLAAPLPPADAQLTQRLQQIACDLQALMTELQVSGQLRPDWQPPSQTPEQEAVVS
ncbi:MAG: twin-arginine translocase TatA/TatE family subunit [Chloroflexales bacterium]|jgi:sec-independent protein translocase protein TatB